MTADGLISLLNTLKIEVASESSVIIGKEAKLLEEDMKKRIFEKGLNSFDSSIGVYMSSKWVDKRAARGLQTGFVDLKFSGELRQSFTTKNKSTKNEATLFFSDSKNAEKANDQEILQGLKAGTDRMDIFDPSKKEIDKLTQSVENSLDKLVEDIFTKFQ
tara:strand:+ start:6705 stop:7184 length:480 start_codon:yes stop_codon:yes gene_type:complete